MKNGFELDFTDNPDVADAFSRKQPGDTFEIKIRGQVNEISDEGVKGTIEVVTVSNAADSEVEVDSEEPVMVVMKGRMGAAEPEGAIAGETE